MNEQAFFSDSTGDYLSPPDPDINEKVIIRFRTEEGDADKVFLVSGKEHLPMEKKATRDGFDYYEVEVQLGEETFYYQFQAIGKGRCAFLIHADLL